MSYIALASNKRAETAPVFQAVQPLLPAEYYFHGWMVWVWSKTRIRTERKTVTESEEKQGEEESSHVPTVSMEQAVPGFQELDGNGVRGMGAVCWEMQPSTGEAKAISPSHLTCLTCGHPRGEQQIQKHQKAMCSPHMSCTFSPGMQSGVWHVKPLLGQDFYCLCGKSLSSAEVCWIPVNPISLPSLLTAWGWECKLSHP